MEEKQQFATAYDKIIELIRNKYPEWRRGINLLSNRLVELVIVSALAVGALALVLYFARGFWAIYIETQVGKIYLADHPQNTAIINTLLATDAAVLALGCAWTALRNLVLVGAACQVTFVLRCLYFSQGLFGRVLFWGLPLAALGAFQPHADPQTSFPAAMLLALVPTLILMPNTFHLVSNYVPEIDDLYRILLSRGVRGLREYWKKGRAEEAAENAYGYEDATSNPYPSGTQVIRLKEDPARPGLLAVLCCNCRRKLVYPNKFAGREVKCRGCESIFVLPGATGN